MATSRYVTELTGQSTKREYDRQYKQDYRAKPVGKEQRRLENQRLRERLGWAEYMRYWRRAEPALRAPQERARAKKYYGAHRAEILAKRRAQRAARKAAQGACSH